MAAKKSKWMEDGVDNPLIINEALFDAALTEFSTHTFKDASLNDIIKAAGLNKGSFYYRFHDKLDMYLSLLHRMGMEKLALFEQLDNEHTAESFFDEFRQKAVLGLRFAQKEPRYNALWRRVLTEERSVREAINACFGDLTNNMMIQMIDKAKETGELRSDISSATAAMVVSTIMDRLDLLVSPDAGERDVLAGVDALLGILKYGISS